MRVPAIEAERAQKFPDPATCSLRQVRVARIRTPDMRTIRAARTVRIVVEGELVEPNVLHLRADTVDRALRQRTDRAAGRDHPLGIVYRTGRVPRWRAPRPLGPRRNDLLVGRHAPCHGAQERVRLLLI